MKREFGQIAWDDFLEHDLRQLIRLAILEDLGREFDWTSLALIPPDAEATADVVACQDGIMAGIRLGFVLQSEAVARFHWRPLVEDAARVQRGTVVATAQGNAQALLACERILLNFLGRMSGIATLANRYVERVAGTKARIYDTRKTLPGYRRLDKYAARCGGAWNHRLGLNDAVLIKDNHLATGDLRRRTGESPARGPAQAVQLARAFVAGLAPGRREMLVELEVDSWDQLTDLPDNPPDILLLDNFRIEHIAAAVSFRDAKMPAVELEVSGGVSLDTVRAIAETGVDRISVGAITHSANCFDFALDWQC